MNGNRELHEVALFDASSGNLVPGATTSVNSSTPSETDGFVYSNLSQPVALQLNHEYYLTTLETTGADTWSDFDSTVKIVDSRLTHTGAVYQYGSEWRPVGISNRSYGPVGLKLLPPGSQAPPYPPAPPSPSVGNPPSTQPTPSLPAPPTLPSAPTPGSVSAESFGVHCTDGQDDSLKSQETKLKTTLPKESLCRKRETSPSSE